MAKKAERAAEVADMRRVVLKLVSKRAPELVDRVRQATDPVEALVDAWVDARELRKSQEAWRACY